jgi:hypothetical protein
MFSLLREGVRSAGDCARRLGATQRKQKLNLENQAEVNAIAVTLFGLQFTFTISSARKVNLATRL